MIYIIEFIFIYLIFYDIFKVIFLRDVTRGLGAITLTVQRENHQSIYQIPQFHRNTMRNTQQKLGKLTPIDPKGTTALIPKM